MDKKSLPKINKNVIKRLFGYISAYKFKLLIVSISIIIVSLSMVAGSLFLQTLIDDYITPLIGVENADLVPFYKAIGVMASIYIVGTLCGLLYSQMMVSIAQGTLKKIRDDLFSKMEKLPIRFFDENTYGDVMSRFTNDTDALERMISDSLPQVFSSIITIVSIAFAMITANLMLSLVVALTMIVILAVTRIFTSKSAKYFLAQQKSVGKVNGYIEEMINGQKVVKVFNYEDRNKAKFNVINEELCNNAFNASKYSSIIFPTVGALGNVQYVVIALLGGLMTVYGVGNVTVGMIVSFLQLSKTFVRPIGNISQQINSVIMALAGASRIFEVMDEEPETDDGYVTLVNIKKENDKIIETEEKTEHWAWKYPHHSGELEYVEVKGHIEMTDVDFGYKEGKTVLHNISLYAKPGQKIAFVGATGAGKTTITNLLNRFYDIEDGKIRYDGININKIKKADLRKSLGMVLQDTNLFTGTIKENIKYGNETATDDEVKQAAILANADGFITRLPEGYDTVISGNGSNLSQGQRQLLSIARAALNDPPVMILDEATSSIDTRTEKIVQEGMDKLMEGRTVFVIAHRLSTVRNSKAIMVLDHGRIIERGNHEDLINQKGTYYQLYTGAFELE